MQDSSFFKLVAFDQCVPPRHGTRHPENRKQGQVNTKNVQRPGISGRNGKVTTEGQSIQRNPKGCQNRKNCTTNQRPRQPSQHPKGSKVQSLLGGQTNRKRTRRPPQSNLPSNHGLPTKSILKKTPTNFGAKNRKRSQKRVTFSKQMVVEGPPVSKIQHNSLGPEGPLWLKVGKLPENRSNKMYSTLKRTKQFDGAEDDLVLPEVEPIEVDEVVPVLTTPSRLVKGQQTTPNRSIKGQQTTNRIDKAKIVRSVKKGTRNGRPGSTRPRRPGVKSVS